MMRIIHALIIKAEWKKVWKIESYYIKKTTANSHPMPSDENLSKTELNAEYNKQDMSLVRKQGKKNETACMTMSKYFIVNLRICKITKV